MDGWDIIDGPLKRMLSQLVDASWNLIWQQTFLSFCIALTLKLGQEDQEVYRNWIELLTHEKKTCSMRETGGHDNVVVVATISFL